MDIALSIASWVFLTLGGLFCLVGAIGINRMPDSWTRMHAASVIDTLGAGLLIIGMCLQAGFTIVTAKLLIVALLIFFASPTAGHAIARALKHRNVKPLLEEDLAKGGSASKESQTGGQA